MSRDGPKTTSNGCSIAVKVIFPDQITREFFLLEIGRLQRFPIGSIPLLVMARAASAEARNLTIACAAAASLVLTATPAENTETFCTSAGSGVT
jgi:hypothetical protein